MKNQTTLITGGTTGIGLATARLLPAESSYNIGENINVDGGVRLT